MVPHHTDVVLGVALGHTLPAQARSRWIASGGRSEEIDRATRPMCSVHTALSCERE